MALINCTECKAEVSDQAESCPKCGHPLKKKIVIVGKYRDYSEVPWYRKSGIVLFLALFLTPLALPIALSGRIYYQKKGELKKWGILNNIVITFYGTFATLFVLKTLL